MSIVRIVSKSDLNGGAARAAFRLKQALLAYGHDAEMHVQRKESDDWRVIGPKSNIQKGLAIIRPIPSDLLARLQNSGNRVLHSANILPSKFNCLDTTSVNSITNIHWVGSETISIKEIGRINGPVIWTMHDMWAFCGAEHYVDDSIDARFRTGYTHNNRVPGSRGFDLDRWVWNRKCKYWNKPMTIVAPSRWLAGCAEASVLMRDWPINIVPNPLDVSLFRPYPKDICCEILQLPKDVPLIMFGALNGTRDYRKGFDLLCESLEHLCNCQELRHANCVVVGQSRPKYEPKLGFKVHWMGHVHDDWTMALLYSAADVVVVPSRAENLPQFCTEAQACGTPVVAFDCSGLPDAVEHLKTGYLASPFSTEDLAEGIRWVLSDSQIYAQLSAMARERAESLWNYETVVKQYNKLFKEVS